ncbi:MAG: hypothetical protein GY807_21175 [Gammaproteobacteria bacterium]|nr:hypothetical protein [Gammaproteobacteria bacterium]
MTTIQDRLRGGEPDNSGRLSMHVPTKLELEAADIIDALILVVKWYGEQARLARLIHSGGDKGRHKLSADGGKKAVVIIKSLEDKP